MQTNTTRLMKSHLSFTNCAHVFSWCPQFAFILLLSGGGQVQTAMWYHRGPGSETCHQDMKASHKPIPVFVSVLFLKAEHASHSVRRKHT